MQENSTSHQLPTTIQGLMQRTIEPPYSQSKTAAPKTMNQHGLLYLYACEGYLALASFVLAILGGLIYFFFSPIIDLICTIILRCSVPRPNYHTKSIKKSEGEIARHKDPQSGRTYVTRYFNPRSDSSDCSKLIASGFSMDPFTKCLQPDKDARRLYGHLWYKSMLESSNLDVIVQEWEEAGKLVGVILFNCRHSTFLEDLIDQSKYFSQIIRFLLLGQAVYPSLMLGPATHYKACEIFKDVATRWGFIKMIAVEKGCQGQGIGSNLLKHTIAHFDALGLHSYLESSNFDNIPIYEKFGFQVLEEWKLLSTVSPLWLMIRPNKKENNHRMRKTTSLTRPSSEAEHMTTKKIKGHSSDKEN